MNANIKLYRYIIQTCRILDSRTETYTLSKRNTVFYVMLYNYIKLSSNYIYLEIRKSVINNSRESNVKY